jgi:hypothetical protein
MIVEEMVVGNEGFGDGTAAEPPAGVAFGAAETVGAPPVCAEAKRATAITLAKINNRPLSATIFTSVINPSIAAAMIRPLDSL